MESCHFESNYPYRKKMKYPWLVFEFEGYLIWPISFRRGEIQVILKNKITVTALVRLW